MLALEPDQLGTDGGRPLDRFDYVDGQAGAHVLGLLVTKARALRGLLPTSTSAETP
jgi:hypothetical protein